MQVFGNMISFVFFFFSTADFPEETSEYSDSVFKEFPDEAKVDFDIGRGWGYSSIDRELA